MSTSTAQGRASKKRPYRLGKREAQLRETRQRIVEAAVELHGTLGPARTTVSQIADRAGVQRHTFYAHFPDDRSLWLACSARAMERDPLPDVEQWANIPSGRQRLLHGLEQIYGWYDRNAELSACVLRDSEIHPLTREMVELRMQPTFDRATALLGEGLSKQSLALLGVALDFACWRRLSETLGIRQAAGAMAIAVLAQGRPG